LPEGIEREEVLPLTNIVMKKKLLMPTKYSLVSLLLFVSTLIWVQATDNLKYFNAKEPTKITKENQKINLSSLFINLSKKLTSLSSWLTLVVLRFPFERESTY